jgi:hypothetical protein
VTNRASIGLLLSVMMCGPVPALALDDFYGPFGGKTSFYGQFSPSLVAVADGVSTRANAVDNSHSVSRIGFYLDRPILGLDLSFRFETALGLRQSNATGQDVSEPLFEWTRSEIRFADAIWKLQSGSTFYFGHGSMASDGATAADLSGTTLANGVSVPDMAGGFQFRTAAGDLSSIEVKSAYATFDGIRRARVRYDLAPINGFRLAVSAGNEILERENSEQNVDVALRYDADSGVRRVRSAISASITRENGTRTRKDVVGSASILHYASGLNASLATGSRAGQGRFIYVKLGYIADIVSAGPTSFSTDYHFGRDFLSAGSTSEAWGLAAVQTIERHGIELYLGYRRYAISDLSGAVYQPLQAIQFGTRWQF